MYLKSKIIHVQSLSIFAILPRSITVWGHFNVILLSSVKCHSQWEEHWGILLRTCLHGEIYLHNGAGITQQWYFIGIHHATTDTAYLTDMGTLKNLYLIMLWKAIDSSFCAHLLKQKWFLEGVNRVKWKCSKQSSFYKIHDSENMQVVRGRQGKNASPVFNSEENLTTRELRRAKVLVFLCISWRIKWDS